MDPFLVNNKETLDNKNLFLLQSKTLLYRSRPQNTTPFACNNSDFTDGWFLL